MKFEIVSIPAGPPRNKHAELRAAMLELKEGESVRLPRDYFRGQSAEANLRMKRICGRAAIQKTIGDSIYLWLTPATTREVA